MLNISHSRRPPIPLDFPDPPDLLEDFFKEVRWEEL